MCIRETASEPAMEDARNRQRGLDSLLIVSDLIKGEDYFKELRTEATEQREREEKKARIGSQNVTI